ncbi:12422_t:CDS:2, partial [Racocetra fulgida]
YAAQHQIKIDPLPPASHHPEPSASSQQSRSRSQQRKTTLAQIREKSSSPQQEELEIRHRQLTPYYVREESSQQTSSPQYLPTIPESPQLHERLHERLHESGPIITSATGVSHDEWFNYNDSPDLTGQNPEEFDSYSYDASQSQSPEFLSTSSQPIRDEEQIEIEFQPEQPQFVEPLNIVSAIVLIPVLQRTKELNTEINSSNPQTSAFTVFDRKAKKLQRDRAALDIEASKQVDYLKDEVAYRLVDRLLDVKRKYDTIVDLGCGCGHVVKHIDQDISKKLLMCDMSVDEELLPFKENSLEAVISNLSLHWVNDLP